MLKYFTFLIMMLFQTISFGQGATPMVTYVWECEAIQDEYIDQANWLTKSFENEVLDHRELYMLVERNDISEVKDHENLNKKLGGDQVLRVSVSESSNQLQPGAYFSGNLEYDDGSGEFRLIVYLNSVTGSGQKMRQAELSIPKGLINDHSSRQEAVAKLFKRLHAEEQKAVKEEVNEWFDRYIFMAKELETQLKDMDSWLPLKEKIGKSQEAQEQYVERMNLFAERITDYNEIIEDLLNDRSKFVSDFCLYWEGDPCRDYGRLLDKVLTFHDRLFNDDSNDIIILINQYTMAKKSKEESAVYEKISDARDEILDDFSRDFIEVQYAYRDFEDDVSDILAAY